MRETFAACLCLLGNELQLTAILKLDFISQVFHDWISCLFNTRIIEYNQQHRLPGRAFEIASTRDFSMTLYWPHVSARCNIDRVFTSVLFHAIQIAIKTMLVAG